MEKDELLAACSVFRVVSGMLHAEPTEEGVRALCGDGVFEAAPFGAGQAAVEDGLGLLRRWSAGACVDARAFAEAVGDIRRDWLRLFVGAGEPLAPAWAGYYTDPNHQILGRQTLPVRRLYRSFGLRMERYNSEPDDDLGVMLEFLAFLIEREVAGLGDAASPSAEEAQRALLEEHVLPWLPAWRHLVGKHARTDYFRGVGQLAFGLCTAFAGLRFGIAFDSDREAYVARAR